MTVVLCEYSKFRNELNIIVTIRSDPEPIQLFKIFEYLFKHDICKEVSISVEKCGCLQCYVNNGCDSWLFLKSFYGATMTHQILEEYNSLPTTQGANKTPNNCWNYRP